MTVNLLHSFFSPVLGGQERRMHQFCTAFLNRGDKVVVCAPTDGINDARSWDSLGVQVAAHPVLFSNKPASLVDPVLYVARLRRFLCEQSLPKPDLVLCFQYCYVVAAKKTWPSAKVVFMVGAAQLDWATSLYAHRGWQSYPIIMAKGPAMYYVERAALNLADVVCVEGEFLKDRLLHYHRFARRKMLIISPPIDILRFRPRADVRDTVRGEMGLSGTTQLILGVGRLDANKNFVTLVRAASQLTPGGWRMAIAGTGREEQRLRTLIKGCSLSDCVELLGHRDNIEALYAGADIFAHPTVLDSYGNTVLEAMASRLPCVVSNGPKVGIARELQDGTNAVLANPRKPAHWAACLERLIHDRALRQHLGANARTFCEKQPTVSQCIEMILDSVGLTRSDQRAEA